MAAITHTIDSLAEALYEGTPQLNSLAENMAIQYGKANALSYFSFMSDEVQFFWKDIARQIIRHSSQWESSDKEIYILSDRERLYLRALKAIRETKIEDYCNRITLKGTD